MSVERPGVEGKSKLPVTRRPEYGTLKERDCVISQPYPCGSNISTNECSSLHTRQSRMGQKSDNQELAPADEFKTESSPEMYCSGVNCASDSLIS